MNHRKLLFILIAAILLLGETGQFAVADIAPPQQPPVGPIENGGFPTHVQMVSEEVLLVISEAEEPVVNDWNVTSDYVQGHVEATFWMQNQGDETESFDVWFPLGAEDGFFNISNIYNFAATVDGIPATIKQVETPGEFEPSDPLPWATWAVTFPPGETVVITVTYDLRPTGYMPYGRFIYILETGAGWWGEIGEGTITVRLPYEVDKFNTPFYRVSRAIDHFQISGTDLIWHFTDLEPVRSDNIYVDVIAPSRWKAILAAQEAVAKNPDSSEAYYTLANAQADGLNFKYGLLCCDLMADAAIESYRKAWVLDANNVEAQISYLDLLLDIWFFTDTAAFSDDIPSLITSAIAIAPEDERLLDLIERVAQNFQYAKGYEIDTTVYDEAEDEIYVILGEAVEKNPGNERLLELYYQFGEPVGG